MKRFVLVLILGLASGCSSRADVLDADVRAARIIIEHVRAHSDGTAPVLDAKCDEWLAKSETDAPLPDPVQAPFDESK